MNIYFFLRFFFLFCTNVDKKPNYWGVIGKVKGFYSPCCWTLISAGDTETGVLMEVLGIC